LSLTFKKRKHSSIVVFYKRQTALFCFSLILSFSSFFTASASAAGPETIFRFFNDFTVPAAAEEYTTKYPNFKFGTYIPSRSKIDERIEACRKDTQTAIVDCDEDRSSDMVKAKNFAQQLVLGMGMMAAMDINTACSNMGQMATMANAAMASLNASCAKAVYDCDTSCEDAEILLQELKAQPASPLATPPASPAWPNVLAEADKAIDDVRANQKICNKRSGVVQSTGANILNTIAGMMNAKKCQDQTSNSSLDELCKKDPNHPFCKKNLEASCSDPNTAQNNLVCVCQANPGDTRCRNRQYASMNTASPGSGSGAGAGAGTEASTGGSPDFSDMQGFDTAMESSIKGDQASEGLKGGSGGGGGGLDSTGSGSRNAGGGGGAPSAGFNTKVNAGFGAAGGGGGSTASRRGPGDDPRAPAGTGGVAATNLARFMPTVGPRSRSIGSAAGPDGMTDALGKSNFEKANFRYFDLQNSFDR
jgi:hypothetical protein